MSRTHREDTGWAPDNRDQRCSCGECGSLWGRDNPGCEGFWDRVDDARDRAKEEW